VKEGPQWKEELTKTPGNGERLQRASLFKRSSFFKLDSSAPGQSAMANSGSASGLE